MSRSVWVSLSPNVPIHRVAAVLGRLLGHHAHRAPLGPRGWFAEVLGVSCESCEAMPECAWIVLSRAAAPPYRRILYHFEGPGGRRLLSFAYDSADGQAIARGLADFFGGRVTDDQSGAVLYSVPDKPDAKNCPQDGGPWVALQTRILRLRSIQSPQSNQELLP